MLAYSSVAQIGYIFMGIGLGSEAGMLAACFHVLAHAVTKSMLFLCCGTFIEEAGGKEQWKTSRGRLTATLWQGLPSSLGLCP